MRVLVTWGSKRGGTAGIGQMVAEAIARRGYEVVAAPAHQVASLEGFDGVVIGGALYANCWPAPLRRFVLRHTDELRHRPVWLFSSGPLDDSPSRRAVPPPDRVAVLADHIGAQGHVTFGGRLEPDAEGFPAPAMAKESAGDWRDRDRIEGWAEAIADDLPGAAPRPPVVHPGHAAHRVITHGLLGWALSAATLALLIDVLGLTAALIAHAVAAPLFFIAVARHYFGARGAREPLTTAAAFAGMTVLLDLLVLRGGLGFVATTLLPALLVFAATWATGAIMATLPWPAPDDRPMEPGQEQRAQS